MADKNRRTKKCDFHAWFGNGNQYTNTMLLDCNKHKSCIPCLRQYIMQCYRDTDGRPNLNWYLCEIQDNRISKLSKCSDIDFIGQILTNEQFDQIQNDYREQMVVPRMEGLATQPEYVPPNDIADFPELPASKVQNGFRAGQDAYHSSQPTQEINQGQFIPPPPIPPGQFIPPPPPVLLPNPPEETKLPISSGNNCQPSRGPQVHIQNEPQQYEEVKVPPRGRDNQDPREGTFQEIAVILMQERIGVGELVLIQCVWKDQTSGNRSCKYYDFKKMTKGLIPDKLTSLIANYWSITNRKTKKEFIDYRRYKDLIKRFDMANFDTRDCKETFGEISGKIQQERAFSNQQSEVSASILHDLTKIDSETLQYFYSSIDTIFDKIEADIQVGSVQTSLPALNCINTVSEALLEPGDASTNINDTIFFPGNQHLAKLWWYLNQATRSLLVCVYNITNANLLDLLLKLSRTNEQLKIEIITDGTTLEKNRCAEIEELKQRISIIHMPLHDNTFNKKPGLMHNKYIIIDNTCVITGSFNWSYHAVNVNRDNLLLTSNPLQVRLYREDFMRI